LVKKIPTPVKGEVPTFRITDFKEKIGLVSDTHFVSKTQQISGLHKFYSMCEEEGIDTILHAGDLIDGIGVYDGQPYDTFLHQPDQMIKYVVDNYPSFNGQTWFIGGNHDSTVKDFGTRVTDERSDMLFLGNGSAIITINEKKIFIHHGKKGSEKYARSNKPQQLAIAEAKHVKIVPDIIVLGHYHNVCILPDYGGIFVIQMPCFQAQVRWNLEPNIGGVILDLCDSPRCSYQKFERIIDDF